MATELENLVPEADVEVEGMRGPKGDKGDSYVLTEADKEEIAQKVDTIIDAETDKTLTLSGKPADAKATGDAIDDLKEDLNEINDSVVLDIKGGEKQIDFTPTIRQFVISDATGKITTDSTCRSMYFECKPSMKYRIDRIAGTRFTVGFTSSLPEDNVVCSINKPVRTYNIIFRKR